MMPIDDIGVRICAVTYWRFQSEWANQSENIAIDLTALTKKGCIPRRVYPILQLSLGFSRFWVVVIIIGCTPLSPSGISRSTSSHYHSARPGSLPTEHSWSLLIFFPKSLILSTNSWPAPRSRPFPPREPSETPPSSSSILLQPWSFSWGPPLTPCKISQCRRDYASCSGLMSSIGLCIWDRYTWGMSSCRLRIWWAWWLLSWSKIGIVMLHSRSQQWAPMDWSPVWAASSGEPIIQCQSKTLLLPHRALSWGHWLHSPWLFACSFQLSPFYYKRIAN